MRQLQPSDNINIHQKEGQEDGKKPSVGGRKEKSSEGTGNGWSSTMCTGPIVPKTSNGRLNAGTFGA